ncbi:MAG TPA: DUF1573 domain-containing protein [Anaerolineae bacterium]|nr:DUF1573 domain-containing protein [Anaerolineae bacterium]
MFVALDEDDLHLTWDSPCIDASDPELEDPDETRSDIGAYFFPQYPVIGLDPDSITFGRVFVDRSAEVVLVIENTGYQELRITDIQVEGDFYDVDFTEAFALAHAETVAVEISFAPTEEGDFVDRLNISSNAFGRPVAIIPLAGSGYRAYPPEVIGNIDDLHLEEDFERMRIADVDEIFSDQNVDELQFTALCDNQNIVL